MSPCSLMIFFSAAPICAGDLTTATPAASRAAILSVAVPLPPEMMAPAWPIRRPGGAVSPEQQALESQMDRPWAHCNINLTSTAIKRPNKVTLPHRR